MSRVAVPTMGTVASIAVSAEDDARLGADAVGRAVQRATERLRWAEGRFSHYDDDSDINRYLTGRPVTPEAVADVQAVLARCHRLHADSDGVFTIRDPRTGGVDTAGYVKGLAIARAAEAMQVSGVRNGLVSVGGDSTSWGRASRQRPWRVAVADPRSRGRVVAVVDASDRAVATSGTAERGEHIWRPAGSLAGDVLSFTVVGPDIAQADAYATIGFALGRRGISWVAGHRGYTSLVVLRDGSLVGDAGLVSAV